MFLSIILILPLLALAHPDGSDCSIGHSLPSKWCHEAGHPVEQLFNRANPTDGVPYAEVGSPEWAAGFPDLIPDVNTLPQQWVDALNAAVAAGKIPDIPVTTNEGGIPAYPTGVDPGGQEVCSGMIKCRAPGDIWDAPDGVLSISFDDGPYLVSDFPGWAIFPTLAHALLLFWNVPNCRDPPSCMISWQRPTPIRLNS